MTPSERIREMLEKERVEHVGASGWFHTPECDRLGNESYVPVVSSIMDYSDWDFLKVMSTSVYMQEAFGEDIAFTPIANGEEAEKARSLLTIRNFLVKDRKDALNFHPIDVRSNPIFQREAAHIRGLKEHYGDYVPILPTLFLPCHTLPEFLGGIPRAKECFRDCPEIVDHMVKAIYETEKDLMDYYIESGADGFFFSTRWGSREMLEEKDFVRFCYPYETDLIHRVRDRTWFNMIHAHGSKEVYWKYFMDYEVQAYNWENTPYGIPEEERDTVAKVRSLTNKILVTGTDQAHDFYGEPEKVYDVFLERVEKAAKESGDNRLILAAGCTLPSNVPRENVHQLRRAVDAYNRK